MGLLLWFLTYRLSAYAGLGLLQSQGSGGQVADLGGSKVLDGTGIGEAGLNGPLLAMRGEELEGCAVQLHQRLADHRLVSTVAAFHVHHLGNGHTAGDPLFSGSLQVGNLGPINALFL